ncbi:hypothetical protein LTR22_025519 [Elasticomyces elasticus]|nr:hypothetical protein LTR22_025519 [Elasticomyces elasticus]
MPSVKIALLAELTKLALQNRDPAVLGAVEALDAGAAQLANLLLQLERQWKRRRVSAEDALKTLEACFAYWQTVLASQRGSSWNPQSYKLASSWAWALRFSKVRLFASSNGYVGFAPGDVEAGDTIVFLRGAVLPVVLRRYGDRWILRGFIYLCGVMKGELKGAEGEPDWDVKPFVLC